MASTLTGPRRRRKREQDREGVGGRGRDAPRAASLSRVQRHRARQVASLGRWRPGNMVFSADYVALQTV